MPTFNSLSQDNAHRYFMITSLTRCLKKTHCYFMITFLNQNLEKTLILISWWRHIYVIISRKRSSLLCDNDIVYSFSHDILCCYHKKNIDKYYLLLACVELCDVEIFTNILSSTPVFKVFLPQSYILPELLSPVDLLRRPEPGCREDPEISWPTWSSSWIHRLRSPGGKLWCTQLEQERCKWLREYPHMHGENSAQFHQLFILLKFAFCWSPLPHVSILIFKTDQ